MELKINIAAILVAVVVNFILGFIWYTLLFGQLWGKEMGYDPNVKAESKVMIKGMLFMVIGNFLFAWVFAHNIAAWQFVPVPLIVPCVGEKTHSLGVYWSVCDGRY